MPALDTASEPDAAAQVTVEPTAARVIGDVVTDAPATVTPEPAPETTAAAALPAREDATPVAGLPAPSVAVSMRAITRRFDAATAIDAVDLDVKEREFVVLLGDNGAGKTTLLNILGGHAAADSGEVLLPDAADRMRVMPSGSLRSAFKAGIGTVSSPPALAETLTALQNILLGVQSYWRPRLSRRVARKRIAELMQRLDLRIALDIQVARLAAGERVRIAVLRALYRPLRVLVLDEPTTTLTPQESESLFRALKRFTNDGLSVVVSARKLDESFAFADRVVVLRAGRKLVDQPADDANPELVEALLSDRPAQKVTPTFHSEAKSILELRKVDAATADLRSRLREASLEVRAGEIVGVAGIADNGQDALADVVTGHVRPSGGEMLLFGRRLARFDAAAFGRAGVSRLPRERRRDGVVASMTVAENLTIEDIGRPWLHRWGLLKRAKIKEHAREVVAEYGLPCQDPDARLADLPARSIEMLVLARMLDQKPRLIVADNPTRGLDAELAAEVHCRLDDERRRGTAILLISDDIDELFTLADAISVIHRGRITVPYPNGAFDRNRLGLMMGGHGSLAQDWAGWGEGA
jgi:simple sugar transport system ATP-binding protein